MRGVWVLIGLMLAGAAHAGTAPAATAALICGGSVAPGLAYPDAGGAWRGSEIDLCAALAKRVGARPIFLPVFQDSDTPPPKQESGKRRSVVFLPAGDIPAGYLAGPVIFDDSQAIMVPAGSHARRAADLGNASICVEPGSPEDFNLVAYFQALRVPLREFVFQETDEMHDAYVAGRCDAITARRSLLIGLRANAGARHASDVILPDNLGDNPVRAATPAGQTAWAAIVAKTIREADDASHS